MPILGDARSEHMLLAARKLGRERVARIVPSTQLASSGVNPFRGMLFPVSPYTPRHIVAPQTPTGPRVSTIFSPTHTHTPSRYPLFSPTIIRQASPNQHPRPNAVANAAAAAAANVVFAQKQETIVPTSPSKQAPSTPKRSNGAPGANGLENLFIAAKRVFDEEDEGQALTPTKKRRVEIVSSVESKTPETAPGSSVETEMTALQVLAQQAITLGSHEQDVSGAAATARPLGGTVDVTVTEDGSNTSERRKPPNASDVSQTSGRTSYLKYAPDYKTRPNLGSLPPAPDYSAAFVGTKTKAKATPLTKSASLPLVTRPSSIVNPYSPRVLNLSIRQNATHVRSSPSRQPTTFAQSSPQGRASFPEGHAGFSVLPFSATRSALNSTQSATSGNSRSGGDDNGMTRGRGTPTSDSVPEGLAGALNPSSDAQPTNGRPYNTSGTPNGKVSKTETDRVPQESTAVLRESTAPAIAT